MLVKVEEEEDGWFIVRGLANSDSSSSSVLCGEWLQEIRFYYVSRWVFVQERWVLWTLQQTLRLVWVWKHFRKKFDQHLLPYQTRDDSRFSTHYASGVQTRPLNCSARRSAKSYLKNIPSRRTPRGIFLTGLSDLKSADVVGDVVESGSSLKGLKSCAKSSRIRKVTWNGNHIQFLRTLFVTVSHPFPLFYYCSNTYYCGFLSHLSCDIHNNLTANWNLNINCVGAEFLLSYSSRTTLRHLH